MTNMMASGADILRHTLLQMNVPNEQRGRAMGVRVVCIGSAPLGQLEMGYLAGLAGSPIALLANGEVLSAGVLAMDVVLPRLRRI